MLSPSTTISLSTVLLVLLCCVPAMAQPPASSEVRAWEDSITIPTYAWHDDVNPVFSEYEASIYYPYTRQDLISKKKTDRTYKTLCLENEFLRVTCIPELGGRIASVFDKTTNEEMFHGTDVIKPALIAMRGAWICGGIEWNVGPQGHTVTIVSPVDGLLVKNADGSASVVVGNTEKMFRTRWSVRLTLHPGKAFLDEDIRLFNPTDGIHPYYFWNCTGFPNRPGTRFIYPMSLGTDHAGTTFYSWPIHKGKDLTWLKNYPTMSSIFAYECIFDFFGAYDVDRNRGIVSYANHHIVKGKKAWTWGQDDFGVVSQMSLSDAGRENSQYIEIQTGPLLTQADYGMLRPRQAMAWKEYWYPVHGLGDGFEYATREAAVQTARTPQGLQLRILATAEFPGARCVLSQGQRSLLDQTMDLSPRQASNVTISSAPEGAVHIALFAADGKELLSYDTPLNIPKVSAPDLTVKPARADGQPTAQEKYLAGALADSQSSPAGARAAYLEALALDPVHVPSLCGLAVLEIEAGNDAAAAEYAQKAAKRDPGCAMAWYCLGVSQLRQGAYEDALTNGYRAAKTLDAIALGYNLVGRALMNKKDYPGAMAAFSQAREKDARDSQNQNCWLTARFAAGDRESVARDVESIIAQGDPTDFVPRALRALQSDSSMKAFAEEMRAISGEKEFTLLEVAHFFAGLGLVKEAHTLLEGVVAHASDGLSMGPLVSYCLAYYAHLLGDEAKAKSWLDRTDALSADYVFPSRLEELDVLRYATAVRPKDAQAHLLLGNLLAGLHRNAEALPEWQAAVENNPQLSTAWRALGLQAWKTDKQLDKAADCYRKALAGRPEDQILYRDLAEILTAQNKRPEAIVLVQNMPPAPDVRYDIVAWLGRAYLDEKRYDECIDFMRSANSSNWEGVSAPRDIYVEALMARGKIRFENGQKEAALGDFQTALTYPENLEVGERYKRTDAETRYWLGKTLLASGRREEACIAWQEGASQISSAGPAALFITVTPVQDEHVKRCATALEILKSEQP